MTDRTNQTPKKSGSGIKDKPLSDDEKLLLRMIGTMRPGFAMKDWAEIASKGSMTDNQAKQRFEKRRDKFVAEDAHGHQLRYPGQNNTASGPTSSDLVAPVTRQTRQAAQSGRRPAQNNSSPDPKNDRFEKGRNKFLNEIGISRGDLGKTESGQDNGESAAGTQAAVPAATQPKRPRRAAPHDDEDGQDDDSDGAAQPAAPKRVHRSARGSSKRDAGDDVPPLEGGENGDPAVSGPFVKSPENGQKDKDQADY
ncbi:hypothetical protein PG988_003260 [Apiospora saccharicola]